MKAQRETPLIKYNSLFYFVKTTALTTAALLLLVLVLAALASPSTTIQQQQQQQQHRNQHSEGKGIYKRSFAGLGCLGIYDKAKFARLDRVCEECYQLYREPDIHTACRQDCFRNTIFGRCVDALLLSHESKKFEEMVEELYGK